MRYFALFMLCLLMLAPGLSRPSTAAENDRVLRTLPDALIIPDLLQRINALRERRGLHPYQLNARLNIAAQDQANWLVRTGIRAHARPNGSRASDRAALAGYVGEGWCCGENYYMSIDATPDMVYDFWVASPPHYVNLTNTHFTEIGIGMASDGYRHSYVLVFGKPDASMKGNVLDIVFQIASSALAPESLQPETNTTISDVSSRVHIVRPGENLFRIGLRYGVSHTRLALLNNIANPGQIYVGQVIQLP